jgi:hypothetical protein
MCYFGILFWLELGTNFKTLPNAQGKICQQSPHLSNIEDMPFL